MTRRFATATVCLLAAMASVGSVRAQDVPSPGETPGPGPRQASQCAGVLCGLTPSAMDRPILAEDARRMEAERASQPVDAALAPDAKRHRRVARHDYTTRTHGRSVAVHAQTPRQRHAETRALAASRPEAKPTERTMVESARPAEAGAESAPINAIFVLAPRPFDPYGGDYAPWLGRLSWPSHFDRADDRTTFSTDGYREAEHAPVVETVAGHAADDLARRTDALSQRGFQALKADLGRN